MIDDDKIGHDRPFSYIIVPSKRFLAADPRSLAFVTTLNRKQCKICPSRVSFPENFNKMWFNFVEHDYELFRLIHIANLVEISIE